MPPSPHRKALTHLRAVDPILASIIDRVGPCRLEARRTGTHYDALVRSIVFQQLSGKAAGTIHRRFCEIYPAKRPRAHHVLATADEALRAAGLSRQKIGYLRDLSARVADGSRKAPRDRDPDRFSLRSGRREFRERPTGIRYLLLQYSVR